MSDQGAAPAAVEGAAAPVETTHETAAQPASPAAEQARKWKLRNGDAVQEVGDAELLETLLGELGEDGVVSAAQISKAARAKMRAASDREKQLRAIEQGLQDPRKVRSILDKMYGKNGGSRALAEEWIAAELEDARKPEHVREKEQVERELAELRAEAARLKKEKEERELGTKTQQAQRAIGQKFAEALKATGVPATEYAIAQMAQLAEADLDDGVPIDPMALAKQVRKRLHEGDLGSVLRSMEPEQLSELLGPETLRKFRQWDVSRVKAAQRPQQAQASTGIGRARPEKKTVHVDDFFSSLRGSKR